MEFNVKGITFKLEELTTIKLSEIPTQTVSRAHYFHLLPSNKKAVLLLRAGDFVETAFVDKYIGKGLESIYQLEIINEDDLNFYKSKWASLKNARTQKDQFLIRDEIMGQLAQDFWASKEKSFLSFVIACFEEFYIYPPKVLDKYQEVSMILYTRALLISSVSCAVSLSNNYVDYHFIKDFYNTSFIMDFGLIEFGTFNFMMSMACESERNKPGSGLLLLENKGRSKIEIQAYKEHPNVSYRAVSEYKSLFTYPEVLENIKMHHEKYDGSGFPNGYYYTAMSDTETLLTFCDYMIPFEEHIFSKGDGHQILSQYFEKIKLIDDEHKLPVNRLITNWESVMAWAIKDIEVAS
ncbi:MAG: hypothetical protein ACJAS4_003071 [Bacteriovoracaceae bacterium]|jgi:hypothetical protein